MAMDFEIMNEWVTLYEDYYEGGEDSSESIPFEEADLKNWLYI